MTSRQPQRIIIGISGSSGIIYGIRMLQVLQRLPIETHLVVSKAAHLTLAYESEISLEELQAMADVNYHINDLAADIASGSFLTEGMIVAPCSMRSLAEIANAMTSNLLTRAADVVLKERKRLVLMLRESPYNLAHIENMQKVNAMGGIIAPPVPAFYNRPQTIDDLVLHSVGRVLDLFGIAHNCVKRWNEAKLEVEV